MEKILTSKPMIFAFGVMAACLIAQATGQETPQPQVNPNIGRYQLHPRGNSTQLYVVDTTTGMFCIFEPDAQNPSGFRRARHGEPFN